MFENIENIKLIRPKTAHRTKKETIKNRKLHLFGIGVSGSRRVDFGDGCLESPKGTLIFIPKGYSYEYTPVGTPCISTTINFDADIINAKPKVYDISGFPDFDKLCYSFTKMWSSKTPSGKYYCLSVFYKLIAYLADIENVKYSDKRKFTLIKPAVDYIEEQFLNPDIKVGDLHTLCNISPTYFKRLFLSNMGVNPQKYIEEKRLFYAETVLNEDSNISISKLAALCGYKDPLYFGKVFKKNYGISPSYYKYE